MKENRLSGMKNPILVFLLLVGIVVACQPFEDGPFVSLASREARVARIWDMEIYSVNNLDLSNRFDIYEMNFKEDGKFALKIRKDSDTLTTKYSGKWFLGGSERTLAYSYYPDSVGKGISEDTVRIEATLLRLTKNEMWMRYLLNGDSYYLRLAEQ